MSPRILLKRDWDVPVQPPAPGKSRIGRFVGRGPELDRLVNELVRSPHKAILVSGYRGVGKTSLVYEALNRVEERRQQRPAEASKRSRLKARVGRGAGDDIPQFLYVLQNAAQLDVGDAKGGIEPRDILVNLIRRLYTASNGVDLDVDLRESINRLYRKAVAAEVRLTELDEHKMETVRERERQVTLEVPKRGILRVLPWLAGLAAAAGIEAAWATTDAQKILALLAVPLGAVAVSATLRRTFRSSEASNALTSEYYAFDHSLGNLEFDLEQVHHDLQQRDIRTIYVIDELDKLDAQHVLDVLRFFKNLFTLSSAIFIFVGGEELSKRFFAESDGRAVVRETDAEAPKRFFAESDGPAVVREANAEAPALFREKEYTYFTSKYVLARPLYADVSAFCEQACEGEMDPEAQEAFDLFVRLVAFEARGDYFDLVQRIKDRITGFEGLSPIVDLPTPSARDRARILLQQAVNVIFEESYRVERPSRWSENERVVRTLYEFAHEVLAQPSGTVFEDSATDTLEDAARRDLANLLARVGTLEQSESREMTIRGLPVRISKYVSTGRVPEELPASDYRTEIEQRFVREYDRCFTLVADLHDAASIALEQDPIRQDERRARADELVARVADLGGDAVPERVLAQYAPAFDELTAPGAPSTAYRREVLEHASTSLLTARELLVGRESEVFANILAAARDGIERRPLAERFPEVAADLQAGDISYVAGRDGRGLLVGAALADDVLKHVNGLIAEHPPDKLRVALAELVEPDGAHRLPSAVTAVPPLERSPWGLGATLHVLADWLVTRTPAQSLAALTRMADSLAEDEDAYPGATASLAYARLRLAREALGEHDPETQAALAAAERSADRSWTEAQVLRGHENWIQRGGFVRGGAAVLTSSRDGTARLWDVDTGGPLRVFKDSLAANGPIAVAGDERLIVTAGVSRVVIWEMETGATVSAFSVSDWVRTVTFDPSGQSVITGTSDGMLRLWNWSSGELMQELHGHNHYVNEVAFSPDGLLMVSAGEDSVARIWRGTLGEAVAAFEHPSAVEGACFSPDGERVATACDDRMTRVWNVASGELVATLEGPRLALSAQFSPDGRLLVSGYSDGSAIVWDVEAGDRAAMLQGHTDWVRHAVFSPDGRRILTVSDDARAIVWQAGIDRSALSETEPFRESAEGMEPPRSVTGA